MPVVIDRTKLPGGGQCIWHELPSGERCPRPATSRDRMYCAEHFPRRNEPVPQLQPA